MVKREKHVSSQLGWCTFLARFYKYAVKDGMHSLLAGLTVYPRVGVYSMTFESQFSSQDFTFQLRLIDYLNK